MEEDIIQPIDRDLLKSELTPDKQLRMTNKSHNEIYIVTANDSPNVLKEIGRLREIAFRTAGGGSGKSMDLDEFDFGDNCYKQLIVWNPEADEIIGGYRYLWVKTGNSMLKDSLYWLRVICSISQTSSLKSTCLIPWSWDVPLSHWNIRMCA